MAREFNEGLVTFIAFEKMRACFIFSLLPGKEKVKQAKSPKAFFPSREVRNPIIL